MINQLLQWLTDRWNVKKLAGVHIAQGDVPLYQMTQNAQPCAPSRYLSKGPFEGHCLSLDFSQGPFQGLLIHQG